MMESWLNCLVELNVGSARVFGAALHLKIDEVFVYKSMEHQHDEV